MALLRKFFHRKPPEGLLEISERVFVFDCCFTTTLLEGNEYQVYIGRIVDRLREYLSDVSFMVFNFGDGNNKSQINNVASEYGMTVMDYPCQYVNCPLLTLEMIDHFLKSSESWLSIGQRNVLLIHCQNGAFQILAFVLAAFLISRNQCTGEQKTLDMIYKQASQELLQLLPSLNSLPSQLRYLQYVSRRNIGSKWPPLNKALMLDCVILRVIPNMDGKGGCRPIFRIYGPDPFMDATWTTKMLFSMPQKSKVVEYFKQADCELVKIEINCHVQGDVVLECISLDDNLEHEEMMFHVMFNTAFIQSNILMLNHEEIDVSWNVKNQMPKDFRAEVRFSEMDTSSSLVGLDLFCIQDKEGHPIEAFAKVQDIYSNLLDVGDSETHNAIENGMSSPSAVLSETSSASPKSSLDSGCTTKKIESNELQVSVQRHPQYKIISPRISQSSLSIPASYSNSLQGSSVALSRYRSAPSVLGITALLHDHAEFNNKELCCPSILESSISASAPCILKPAQPTDSSVSPPPEQHPSEKHFINIKSGSKVPPPPPSPPPPRPLLLSAGSLTTQPPIRQLSSSQSLAVPLAPPPPPPPPRIQSTRQLHASELSDSLSSEPVSSLFMLSWQQPPPSLSLLPSVVLSSPPPPPPPPPLPVLSNSNLSPSQLPNTPCNHDPRMSGDIGQWLPPLPPPPPSLISAPANSLSSNCDSLSIPHTASLPYLAIIPTPSIDLSHTTSTPSLPTPLSEEAETSFTNQSLVPSSPPPSSYPSSVTTTLPCLPNTLSACPPPPPPLPRIGTAKPPFLSSIPSPVPLLSSSLTTNASSSPRILPSVTCPLPPIPLLTASPPSLRDSAVLPGPLPPSSNVLTVQNSSSIIPPPPTPPRSSSSTICQDSSLLRTKRPTVPATPPRRAGSATVSTSKCSAPPPPCPPSSIQKESSSRSHQVVPPPPAPLSDGLSKASCPSLHMHSSLSAPLGAKGKLQSWTSTRIQAQSKKTSLKPYHWLKLTRVMQGSLWAEAQQPEEVSKAPELDMSELESLFSATITSSDHGGANGKINRRGSGLKHDKVHLIELRRAYNCEIMLTKVKVPLSDLMNSILTLDDSALDIDQVDNLIKFCPTKEEIELLKNYKGDKENLGKCEKFFLELMKVLRVESKLRVFSFKIQFFSQVSDLSSSLNIVNSASEEVRKSVKLKRIMQTILSLGNALNHGTARGSAVGFRLDSLLKLTETRARNNKTTLMHYLCKVLTAKLPEVLDFHKDLVSLEAATKIQLKYLAEEMQAISKGLEKVVQELTASENDGAVSEHFCKTLKEFFASAEVEVRSLASLYSGVGRNADALAFYFGEDPARCPFEQVVSTLLNFVRMFRRAQEENCKQLEFEKKKAQKEAEIGKAKMNAARKDLDNENMLSSPARISEIQSHP